MTTNSSMLADLIVSVLAALAWLGAGASAAARRPRWSRIAFSAALVATAARVVTVALLAGSGWWFVQEKVLLTLLLLLVGAAVGVRWRTPAAYFAAGYAALAGPAFTLVAGYPVRWGSGLVTLAVVGAAATVTAWVLGVRRLRAPAVASATAALVGAVLLFVTPPASAGEPLPAVDLAVLTGPSTPDAGGVVRQYTLTAQQGTVTLPSGTSMPAWTFNGQVPGPPITANVGDLIEVNLRNADIADGVTLHWHGYDVPMAEDGVPGLTQAAVLPGQSFQYRFRADRAGTYWYHTHEVSDTGVRMGLYGAFVVHPRVPAPGIDLTVAVHTFRGSTVVSAPDASVGPGTPVRLRVINTDDTPRVVGLVGSPVRVAAIDGTDLNAPGELSDTGLRLPAGGRYDVTFPMPDHAVALRIAHSTSAVTLTPTPGGAAATAAEVATWPVLDLLHYGAPAPTEFGADSAFDRDFTLVLDRGLAGGRYAYTVNGFAYPDGPPEDVREGDLVRFTIVNRSQEVHPWHLHGHRVLVLSRDGSRPTGTPLWMDTFDVRPGEVWQVAFRAGNPGVWMNHCHNLSHADQGMMVHLAYHL